MVHDIHGKLFWRIVFGKPCWGNCFWAIVLDNRFLEQPFWETVFGKPFLGFLFYEKTYSLRLAEDRFGKLFLENCFWGIVCGKLFLENRFPHIDQPVLKVCVESPSYVRHCL